MGHPTMQENDTAKLTPTQYVGNETHGPCPCYQSMGPYITLSVFGETFFAFMSITKRYLTSFFSKRRKASFI